MKDGYDKYIRDFEDTIFLHLLECLPITSSESIYIELKEMCDRFELKKDVCLDLLDRCKKKNFIDYQVIDGVIDIRYRTLTEQIM